MEKSWKDSLTDTRNRRKSQTMIKEIFNSIKSSFEEQMSKKIKIPNAFDIQMLGSDELIISTKSCVFYIDLRLSLQFELIQPPASINSVCLLETDSVIFVSLANKTIIALHIHNLSEKYEFQTETNILKLTICQDKMIGKGEDAYNVWKWDGFDLIKQTECTIAGYMTSFQGKYYAKAKKNKWYLCNYDNEVTIQKKSNKPIEIIELSSTQTYLAIYTRDSEEGLIEVFDFSIMKTCAEYKINQSNAHLLLSIQFSSFEDELICSYKNGDIYIISFLKNYYRKYILQNNLINHVKVDQNLRHIYSCGKSYIYATLLNSVYSLTYEFGENAKIFNVNAKERLKLYFIMNKRNKFFISELDLQTCEIESFKISEKINLIKAEYYAKGDVYILAHETQETIQITKYDNQTGCFLDELSVNNTGHFSMSLTSNEEQLIVNNRNALFVYDTKSFSLIKSKQKSNINSFFKIRKRPIILFERNGKKIYFWNFKNEKLESCENKHKKPINCLLVTKNNKHLFTGDVEGKVGIWKLEGKVFLTFLQKHEAPINYLKVINKYLYSNSTDCNLKSAEIKTRTQNISHFENGYSNFFISPRGNWFIHYNDHSIFINENFFNILDPIVVGIHKPLKCMEYIKHLYMNEQPLPYDPAYETAVIFPYNLKMIDFYAYFNHCEYLKMSLKEGSRISNCNFGENALSLAAMQNFRECTMIMINHIVKNFRLEENQYKLRVINNETIVYLNKIRLSNLDSLYEKFIGKSPNYFLPKLIDSDIKTPIIALSDEVVAQFDNFDIDDISSEKHRKEVQFYENYIKFDLLFGSKRSMKFLNSLIKTPNKEILKTFFIQNFLDYKWRKLVKFMQLQAALYILYVVSLIVYMREFKDSNFFVLPFIISNILFSIEFFQIFANYKGYFADFKNITDIIRPILMIVYGTMLLADSEMEELLSIIVYISLFRGIFYFRLFKPTRYLIRLLMDVAYDSIYFLIIFTYTTIATGYVILSLNSDKNIFTALGESYTLNLGDFSIEDYQSFEWIILIIATLVNPILMLNLLISIIAETYSKVREVRAIVDNKERAEMILEIESLYWFNRNERRNSYIQVCSDKGHDKKEDITDKVKMLSNYVKKITKKNKESHKEIMGQIIKQNVEIQGLKQLILERNNPQLRIEK